MRQRPFARKSGIPTRMPKSISMDLREMKDVRNIIAHDYAGAKAADIFAYCREQKPALEAICDRVAAYAGQVLRGT